MFAVDSALQRTYASFREQAARGEISAAERNLLIDGAVLLAANLESLIQDAHAGRPPARPDVGQYRATHLLAGTKVT